jgi:N-acetylglucosamine repressor
MKKVYLMSHFVRANQDLIKAMNRSLLLNIIRREERISRKQLTDLSGLSVGAVSGIVSELLLNNWILEVGEGDYTGGRRQTLVKLNPKAGYAMGIKLTESRMISAITNFSGEIVTYGEEASNFSKSSDEFIRQLSIYIKSCLKKARLEAQRLFGIGLGLAGVINSTSGIVHYSPYFGWRDLPMAQLLQQQIQVPVYIENDVNTLTLTEQLFGAGRHHKNFIVVTIGRGIGMGLVINGQLYRGTRGGAGEFGHIILATGQNSFQSLEDLAADPALLEKSQSQNLQELVKAADAGDEAVRELLAKSGEYLGIGLANLVNILNPELIIVSGEGLLAGDYRLRTMFESLKAYSFNGLLENVEIVVEPTDDKAWARGAASLVISKVFESPILEARAEN